MNNMQCVCSVIENKTCNQDSELTVCGMLVNYTLTPQGVDPASIAAALATKVISLTGEYSLLVGSLEKGGVEPGEWE